MKKKPRTKTKPVRQSKALARRPARPLPAPKPTAPVEQSVSLVHTLTDETQLGEFGRVELKLTEHEEAVLSEPVPESEIRVKPNGLLYLSHPTYTKWFGRAFGRLGWTLVPVRRALFRPREGQDAAPGASIVQEFLLHVHGKPVAYAVGEQEYFEDNREQTYGDALESTQASALRRVAKRLAVGLELWDSEWTARWIDKHCVKVWRDGDKRPSFRRKTSPPFYWEGASRGGRSSAQTSAAPARSAKPAPREASHHGSHPRATPITDGQLRRFWAIARTRGRSDDEVKLYLLSRGFGSSKEIAMGDYDEIIAAIESPEPLLEARDAEVLADTYEGESAEDEPGAAG